MAAKRSPRATRRRRSPRAAALLEAAESDDLATLREATDEEIADAGAELLVKSMHGRGAAFRALVARGVSMEVPPGTYGPIHYAAFRYRPAQFKKLLALGVDVNVPDDRGITPLHHAGGTLETTRALLKAGADPNAIDRLGRTPLHCATRHLGPRTIRVVKTLLQAGADPTIKTRKRKPVTEELRAFADGNSRAPHSKAAKKVAADIVTVLDAASPPSRKRKATKRNATRKKARTATPAKRRKKR